MSDARAQSQNQASVAQSVDARSFGLFVYRPAGGMTRQWQCGWKPFRKCDSIDAPERVRQFLPLVRTEVELRKQAPSDAVHVVPNELSRLRCITMTLQRTAGDLSAGHSTQHPDGLLVIV